MGDRRLGPARVGIGGPVGAGKTALIEALLPRLRARNIDVAVVTTILSPARTPSGCNAAA